MGVGTFDYRCVTCVKINTSSNVSWSSAETSLELLRVRTNWTDLSVAGEPWEETVLVMTNATQMQVYNVSVCFNFSSRDNFPVLYDGGNWNVCGMIMLSCVKYKWGRVCGDNKISANRGQEILAGSVISECASIVHFWRSTGCENIWQQLTWAGIADSCVLLTFLTMGRLAVIHLPLEKEQGTWVPAVM